MEAGERISGWRGKDGGRRSLFGDPGLAHGFDNALYLGMTSRVVAHRRPEGAGAGHGEGRVERETALDCRTGLVESTELREGGGQQKIRCRIISVGFDCPSKPRGRLVPIAEIVLRNAGASHPEVS